jgi:flagellar biosynthetic protein FliR
MVLEFSTVWLLNYVLLLARIAAFVVFVPIPGMQSFPVPAKITLSLMLTLILAPLAGTGISPADIDTPATIWVLAAMLVSEAVLGLAVGVAVALLIESFGLAAQILGFQAGYSYVNMVDPTTQVDATILNVFLTLLGSLLFFAFDLHLYIVKAFAESLRTWPLGSFHTEPADALMMVRLGGLVVETSVRLAAPVIALLLLVDLSLGLLNQVNSRLQLLTLAFPAKIIAGVAMLYPLTQLGPRLFHDLSSVMLEVIEALVHR